MGPASVALTSGSIAGQQQSRIVPAISGVAYQSTPPLSVAP
jgi:hypothetical protein